MITWAVYDNLGVPLPGLPVNSPSGINVVSYVDRLGATRPAPTILDLGGGLYGFVPTANDRVVGTAYVIANVGGFPEYVSGPIHLPEAPFSAWALFDSSGALWTGGPATIGTWLGAPPTGTVVAPLPHLQTVTPTPAQLEAGPINFLAMSPPGAEPAYINATLERFVTNTLSIGVGNQPGLGQIPTTPLDPLQRPRFGAITEVTKDAFITEIQRFFSVNNTRLRSGEFPRIDKYSVSVDPSSDPLSTALAVVGAFPDIPENLPTIAVMSATGRNLKLDLGDKFVQRVIPPAALTSTPGPFTLNDGMTMVVRTYPFKPDEFVESTFTFRDFMFTDISQATAREVANAINAQALYVRASHDIQGRVIISAGGQGRNFPNSVTMMSGTSLAALGFSPGQFAANSGGSNLIYDRYYMAADLTIVIEVLAESVNVRTEISDLLYDFLSFVMADRKWQFYGRTIYDSSVLRETYQIIFKDGEIQFAGESDIQRPGDQKDKIYVNRITIPVTSIMYTDRLLVDEFNNPITPQIQPDLMYREDLPMPN